MREHLIASLHHALSKLDPAALVGAHLPQEPPTFIVAVGKAALPMLAGARAVFPHVPWLAVPPAGAAAGPETGPEPPAEGGLVLPGSHPLPDELSVAAAEAVLRSVSALGESDRLLLLLSGGGSSLLAAPYGVTLAEKRDVAAELMLAGADIHELNAVRKHLSRMKGGRLAAATRASVLSLIVSDVPGDDVGTVASGPVAPDDTTFDDALRVLDSYGVAAPAVRAHLLRGASGEVPENPGPADGVWSRVRSVVIGSNRHLLAAAEEYWRAAGFRAVVLSDRFQGEARDVAWAHARFVTALRTGRSLDDAGLGRTPAQREALEVLRALPAGGGPTVLLSGGETTVTVKGSGRGGRNQEFALWLLRFLGPEGAWVISAGSDGIDGNSPAAGALLSPASLERANRRGLSLDAYLERNDSYGFFAALDDALVTGPTGNNLNDYRAVVVT